MLYIYSGLLLVSLIIFTIYISKYYHLIKKLPKHKSKNWKIMLVIIAIALITNTFSILFALRYSFENFILITLILNMICFLSYVISTSKLIDDFKYLNNLEKDNVTDKLMGIFNRRYFDIVIEEKFNFSKNYDMPLSIVFIDIDNFKLINDNYGHLIGDEILKHCSSLIKKSIRGSDLFCRYGGEEVVIVCENTHLNGAYILAEKIRTLIENSPYIINDSLSNNMIEFGNKIFYTVSIGIAQNSSQCINSNNLVEIADRNLYLAKEKGKNITIF